ncbi:MAG: von Willebrand factor type A domain-containing protein, partial [Candidatus Omnitrophica bacterium]|nr:von Willebrand factor type A domain-containing protein [Candidatus Omnitrophota bacterium]
MVSRKSSDSSVQERPQLVEVSEPEWNLTAVSGPNIRPDDRNEIPRSEKISIGVGGQVKGEAQYLDLDEYVVDRAYHSGGKDDQLKIASTRSGSDSNSTSSPLSSGLARKNPPQNVLVPNFGLEKEVLQAGRVSSQSSPTDGTFFRISELDAIALNRDAPGVPQLVERFEYNESLSYPGTEDYQEIKDNAFKDPLEEGYSTFSIDVDTASYANVRRYLNGGNWPPKDAVRIEEMVNYFDYDYPGPDGEVPFSANIEAATCPWNQENKLVRIGLKGQEVKAEDRGPANLVFLIDVSGSMQPENKLPLLKQGLKLLVQQLQPMDRVAIVTYAGSSGLALPSTSLENRETILGALDTFQAGGSTNGGAGIELAYKTAREHFEEEGINRVILATDGDFNVGVTDRSDLIGLIEKEAKSGIFLS